ncbi:MAG: gliding motility-associated C-terminal domain-containing protein [Bacteroidota bacterium]|nr:gliding motility-associated C-terminal domain-containing protein [Bacteroidota bacterium]
MINFDSITYCYKDTGTYVAKPIAYNRYGCFDTTYVTVYIHDVYTIFIPNAFTPNHDKDNLNETFYPICSNCQGWEMTIYNRWGVNVFFSTDKSNTPQWDGNYKEQPCEQGVYIYQLKVYNMQGQVQNEYKGTVTLLR